jgi:hypothetical protein
MTRVGALVRACHPEPTAAVTAIATALALTSGRGAESGWVAAAFLTGQLSVGWSNDWIDSERDVRSGRTDKPAATGQVPAQVLRTAALVAVAACVPLSLAMGAVAGAAHLVAVAAAWAYNARLKSTALSFLPYAVAFGLVPSIVVLGSTAGPGHRPGRRPPARCSASGHTSRTPCPTCRRTWPTASAGCRTGWAPGPARHWPPCCCWPPRCCSRSGPGVAGARGVLAVAAAAAVTTARPPARTPAGSRAPFRAALVVAAVGVATLLARGDALVAG